MDCRETDLAYIAGFVDGEGSVMISHLKPNPLKYGVLRRQAFYETMKALNSTGHIVKAGELLGHPLCKDNQQPSHLNVIELVEWKVQRLTGEDITANKPDTSTRPEREDIVRTCR